MTLMTLLEGARVVITLGPGGVGKTSTAASLALRAARSRRTLVCTIDPARRLASSLGQDLGDEPTAVAPERFEAAGLEPCTGLYAMMLDPATALDRLLLSAGRDPAAVERLRSHPLYVTMARDLPGMNEYAAVARLHELHLDQRWDLILLDTPPTTHALDFLDSPGRMLRALRSPVVSWLVKPYLKAGRVSLELLGGAKAYVLRRLARIVGTGLLEQMAEFLVLFETVLDGVSERIDLVSQLLSGSDVRYVVVTTPASTSVQEAAELAAQLRRRRLRAHGLVINRVHRLAEGAPLRPEEIASELARLPEVERMAAPDQLRLLKWLSLTHARYQLLARADRAQTLHLSERFGASPLVVEVPLMAEEVHDLGGLARMASHL